MGDGTGCDNMTAVLVKIRPAFERNKSAAAPSTSSSSSSSSGKGGGWFSSDVIPSWWKHGSVCGGLTATRLFRSIQALLLPKARRPRPLLPRCPVLRPSAPAAAAPPRRDPSRTLRRIRRSLTLKVRTVVTKLPTLASKGPRRPPRPRPPPRRSSWTRLLQRLQRKMGEPTSLRRNPRRRPQVDQCRRRRHHHHHQMLLFTQTEENIDYLLGGFGKEMCCESTFYFIVFERWRKKNEHANSYLEGIVSKKDSKDLGLALLFRQNCPFGRR